MQEWSPAAASNKQQHETCPKPENSSHVQAAEKLDVSTFDIPILTLIITWEAILQLAILVQNPHQQVFLEGYVEKKKKVMGHAKVRPDYY